MVDLRYHLVSLAAVLLALAVGVTLGAGPMRDPVTALTGTEQAAHEARAAAAERDGARAAVAAYDRDLAALAEERAAQALSGTTVALVVLPEVPASQVARVEAALRVAEAGRGGTVRLARGWVATDEAQARAALAARLEPVLTEAGVDGPGGDTGQLAAGLGHALVAEPGTVLDVLAGAGLLAGEAPDAAVAEPADVVVVLASPATQAATGGRWADVVAGLASQGEVVVAEDVVAVAAAGGVSPAREAGSVVVHVRQRAVADLSAPLSRVSTVDALGAEVGPWATALAVAAAAEGRHGGYGLLDTAAGPLPTEG